MSFIHSSQIVCMFNNVWDLVSRKLLSNRFRWCRTRMRSWPSTTQKLSSHSKLHRFTRHINLCSLHGHSVNSCTWMCLYFTKWTLQSSESITRISTEQCCCSTNRRSEVVLIFILFKIDILKKEIFLVIATHFIKNQRSLSIRISLKSLFCKFCV